MNNENIQEVEEVQEIDKEEILSIQEKNENIESDNKEHKDNVNVLSENEIQDVLNGYTLEEFNTLKTTNGELKLNEQIFLEMKTTNLYLNLILISVVLCFLYYVISKALKKLFYINIF